MHLIVLGAAAGGGSPQWNCMTPMSQMAWQNVATVGRRTQTSLAVSANDRDWLIINASPDFRQQILATPRLWPCRPNRHTPIQAVVLTSAEIDHIAGLLAMRENQAFTVYAAQSTLDVFAQNPLFRALRQDVVTRSLLTPGVSQSIVGLNITAFRVPGKVPLYQETQRAEHDFASDDHTLGVCIDDGKRRCCFISGCARMTPELYTELQQADAVFFDGTLWRDDELIRLGVSQKTGKRMGHMSIDGPDGTLASLTGLSASHKFLIHVNTTNPVLNAASVERAKVREFGWEVAHDGLEILL